jgi:hypothetical protein
LFYFFLVAIGENSPAEDRVIKGEKFNETFCIVWREKFGNWLLISRNFFLESSKTVIEIKNKDVQKYISNQFVLIGKAQSLESGHHPHKNVWCAGGYFIEIRFFSPILDLLSFSFDELITTLF